jgi:hypothetical protein
VGNEEIVIWIFDFLLILARVDNARFQAGQHFADDFSD